MFSRTIIISFNYVAYQQISAASERSERAAALIWPSRTAHLYIAVSILDFSWLAIFPFMNT